MITVVGVGALGSHFVQFIRNIPGPLVVVDFDRIEAKNVASQFHAKPNVRKSKVIALSQTMDFLFGRRVETNASKVTADNIDAVIGPRGLDDRRPGLVVDCLDNAAGRTLLQHHCRLHSIPLLHGALAANGAFGRVEWSERFKVDSEGTDGAATCENGEHLPFIALTAAYLARAAQIYLDSGKRVGFSISPAGAICV